MLVDLFEQLHPINVSIQNLQALAIHILGIRQMQVSCEGEDLIEELTKRNVEMVASQF